MLTAEPPRLRLALALADQEREQRLRPALDEDPDLLVAAQCLAADQLLRAVDSREVDAVVLAWGLHRLSEDVLTRLERSGLPLVLLAPPMELDRWRSRRAVTLPLDADAATVRAALRAAGRGERLLLGRERTRVESAVPTRSPEVRAAADATLAVLAVAGGFGSPGRTTLAINLAVALGSVAPTVLLDLDLSSPTTLAYLDRDPSRNVCTLFHAVRDNAHAWPRVLRDELQPVSTGGVAAQVLCGLPKPEMRGSLTASFVERLVVEAGALARYVVLDVGPELLGADAAASVHRAALAAAQHVLLVASADLVGLWQARTALAQLEQQVPLERTRLSLILNRYDPRHHHSRAEIEWHLGLQAAAVIAHDHVAAQRAVANQQPLVLEPSSRAGRAILGLAERVHQGSVRLPDPVATRSRRGWLSGRWSMPRVNVWPARGAARRPRTAPTSSPMQPAQAPVAADTERSGQW